MLQEGTFTARDPLHGYTFLQSVLGSEGIGAVYQRDLVVQKPAECRRYRILNGTTEGRVLVESDREGTWHTRILDAFGQCLTEEDVKEEAGALKVFAVPSGGSLLIEEKE